jgi:hypothetical protein
MKFAAMTLMAALTGVAAPTAERNVTVCMEGGEARPAESSARALASTMFARVGVTIKWRMGLGGCPRQGIQVTLRERTPAALYPDALARALPYEGTQIRVFSDRIAQTHGPAEVPVVLAHVLVHEITHLLQGVSRHSDQGVMKAQWEQRDFMLMRWEPLLFTDEDIHLIRQGLTQRGARAARPANGALLDSAE